MTTTGRGTCRKAKRGRKGIRAKRREANKGKEAKRLRGRGVKTCKPREKGE